MKRSRLQIFMVAALLALLGVLGVLQYVWLGQISEAEKDRLTRRLQTDTERFSEDFNREMQAAYVNFQSDAALWNAKDWSQFNERFDFWRQRTSYPDLIKDFYYFEMRDGAAPLRYDAKKREFVPVEAPGDLRAVRERAADVKTFKAFDEEHFAFVMKVYVPASAVERILIRERKPAAETDLSEPPAAKIEEPETKGFLVIVLDADVVRNAVLSDLARKHFPEGDFNLAVTGENGQKIFQTREVTTADSTVKLFDLSPDNLIFFTNREALPRTRTPHGSGVIFNQNIQTRTYSRIETQTFSTEQMPEKQSARMFELKLKDGEAPRTMLQTRLPLDGIWTLGVQHSAGSLDNFIAQTRRRNLSLSFGILGLLAVSILLIFISTHRARAFAQRQVDFVSSVSHEFRTPLAVIYSAGENLADGVAREEHQVSRYGNLIKNEGRKLSAMVEQILDFAGANSGRKKYDFRAQSIAPIIEDALAGCRSLIEEKNFTVEADLAQNLPDVKADAAALSQAIQNLLGNSLKYSNGTRWLKISTRNGAGSVKITVEDKGIGIAPADLKHIFEPFYRAKQVVDEQIHGNGLGLSLVRETVRAHGGRITAESAVGKGSTFIIQLPSADA